MPLSRVTAGHLPALSVSGGWSFANFVQLGGRTFAMQPRGHLRAFSTHVHSYPNITKPGA